MIGLTAGNHNTLGIYTDLGIGANKTSVLGPYWGFGFEGDGSSSNPFPASMITLDTDSNFGWYLNSDGALYYSESDLNPSGWDHMMTFHLTDAPDSIYIDLGNGSILWELHYPYLITWEDLNMGDEDYDDMIYIVDRVVPTPVPGAVIIGFIGIIVAGLKLRKYA